MISAEMHVGRLLEVRFVAPILDDDIVSFLGKVPRLFRSIPENLVVCSDFSFAATMPAPAADQIIGMLRRDNPKLERNGVLLPQEKAGLRLQVERMAREGQNPNRRLFTDSDAVFDWLCEVLHEDEQARLRAFLATTKR